METVAVIWFWSILFGSIALIGVGEKQKLDKASEVKQESVVTVKDAGADVWKGTESSSVRVYWDTK